MTGLKLTSKLGVVNWALNSHTEVTWSYSIIWKTQNNFITLKHIFLSSFCSTNYLNIWLNLVPGLTYDIILTLAKGL